MNIKGIFYQFSMIIKEVVLSFEGSKSIFNSTSMIKIIKLIANSMPSIVTSTIRTIIDVIRFFKWFPSSDFNSPCIPIVGFYSTWIVTKIVMEAVYDSFPIFCLTTFFIKVKRDVYKRQYQNSGWLNRQKSQH